MTRFLDSACFRVTRKWKAFHSLKHALARCCISTCENDGQLNVKTNCSYIHEIEDARASSVVVPLLWVWLHLSVLVLYSFAFRPMVPRQRSRSNLADPDIIFGGVLCFLLFQVLFVLPFNQLARRLRPSSRLGYFSFTVQPMASCQLFVSNVADSDRLSWFLSYPPAVIPTVCLFGTTRQAVNSSSLHSVKRVPFFSSDLVSASIPFFFAPFASSRSVAAPFVFSKADCHRHISWVHSLSWALTVVDPSQGCISCNEAFKPHNHEEWGNL